MSTRLSITLTDAQSAELDRIAAETGATRQSMIGLAISQWLAGQTWLTYKPVSDTYGPEDGEVCEVCGAPATWESWGQDDKEHAYCDKHGYSDLITL